MAAPTLQIQNISLLDIERKFGLHWIQDPSFFPEWQVEGSNLDEFARPEIDRAKQDFLYLTQMPVAEDRVKMVILSPLLSLAGFFRAPFQTTSEYPVELQSEEDGIRYRGRIDVLVLQDQLWLLVIESKRSTYSLQQGVAQALAYMMSAHSDREHPKFAMVTNGFNFQFLKLLGSDYGFSDEFSLKRSRNELYDVLGILRTLGGILIASEEAQSNRIQPIKPAELPGPI